MAGAAMEVCEELVFHGVEYILSVSVGEGQVLLVDVEKVMRYFTVLFLPNKTNVPTLFLHARGIIE
jgi:hypothetical protein